MKLQKIYFDSFKSLVDESLEIKNNCLGIVGINETGKSNILQAIRVLKNDKILNEECVPKIKKETNPKLRFDFTLNHEEKKEASKVLSEWLKTNSLLENNHIDFNFNVQLLIEYDLKTEKEKRNIKLLNIDDFEKDILILKKEFSLNDTYKILHDNNYTVLNEAIIITKGNIQNHIKDTEKIQDGYKKLSQKIEELEKKVTDNKKLINSHSVHSEKYKEENKKHESSIIDLENKRKEIHQILSTYDISSLIKTAEKEVIDLNKEIEGVSAKINQYRKSINKLNIKPDLSAQDKSTHTRYKNSLLKTEQEYKKKTKLLLEKEKHLKGLKVPLDNKYTDDIKEANFYFAKILEEYLYHIIPNVVFWKHSQDYILESNTLFKDILSKSSIDELSRPLLNIFRIGLDCITIEDIKEKIRLIQKDGAERNRFADRLNDELNSHIKNIWKDYDQDIKISLEEHQIRVQFFDPKFNSRSYFNMVERSQGAQTFISFLLTISAEAAKNTLQNTILLLDEPEIHLHPSGVRHMLKELIKISSKGNIVIYATHSIFMIDRDDYSRHIFLKKKDEKTSINHSEIDRIGYFMQEELLHVALNVDLRKDFNTTGYYNFVFEGRGDADLFKHYYENVEDKSKPFKKHFSFYHGGKCGDIKKYLEKNPIQLGTKWIFIIDNDKPGNNLKEFIDKKYVDYLNRDIFVFQYANEDKESDIIELEDIIPSNIIKKVYKKTSLTLGVEIKIPENGTFDKETFQNYNSTILSSIDENGKFKVTFKENLNSTIQKELENNPDLNKFKLAFPKYAEWAANILEEISVSKESKKNNN